MSRRAAPTEKLTEQLRVGKSRIDGRGVFARGRLPGRRKVGEIGGAHVRLPEARVAVERARRIYLIELSARAALDCSGDPIFRHLNHCCRPNCFLRIIRSRVEVYSLRQIPAGHELTIDYGETPHAGGMLCRCGRSRCRGSL